MRTGRQESACGGQGFKGILNGMAARVGRTLRFGPWLAACVAGAMVGTSGAQTAGAYQVTNILSDGFVPALVTDARFVDPWGISIGGRFWVNTAVTGFDFVTSTAGVTAFAVTVPGPGGTGTGQPTGSLQNPGTGFVLSNGTKASFLFSTLDGTVTGWNPALAPGGHHSLIALDNSARSAVYTDLAMVTNASGTYLLAPNFGQGAAVEVYDSNFKPATLTGSFTDPNVPAGYAPYSIHVLGMQVYVTYTLRTTSATATTPIYSEVLGSNTGFVDVFDVNGNFVKRAVTGGNLNAPWGVAIAPASFGVFGGDLLVGNFGDGLITAYDPATYAYLGQMVDGTGKAIAYPGLWALVFGKASYGDPNAMYFSAGLAHETHGLFGVINNVTSATATPAFGMSLASPVATVAAGGSVGVTVSVVPTNGFSGAVTLSCVGLPTGASCTFAPASLAVSANAPALSVVTIATSGSSTKTASGSSKGSVRGTGGAGATGLALAMLLPLGSMLVLRRRSGWGALRLLSLAACVMVLGGASLIEGCSSSYSPQTTPAGMTTVAIQATSGTVSQSSVVGLTIR